MRDCSVIQDEHAHALARSSAACALGVDNVRVIYRDFSVPAFGAIPVTDKTFFDLGVANKFANSCQVREKGLKIVQYVLKAGAYSEAFSKDTSKHLKDLSKTTSIARRFFKFCRCASAGLDPPTILLPSLVLAMLLALLLLTHRWIETALRRDQAL